jgi:hypothetical protein
VFFAFSHEFNFSLHLHMTEIPSVMPHLGHGINVITIFGNRRFFSWFWDYLRMSISNIEQENTKVYSMWLNKVIYMGSTNQLGTNTCHHNKKLN